MLAELAADAAASAETRAVEARAEARIAKERADLAEGASTSTGASLGGWCGTCESSGSRQLVRIDVSKEAVEASKGRYKANRAAERAHEADAPESSAPPAKRAKAKPAAKNKGAQKKVLPASKPRATQSAAAPTSAPARAKREFVEDGGVKMVPGCTAEQALLAEKLESTPHKACSRCGEKLGRAIYQPASEYGLAGPTCVPCMHALHAEKKARERERAKAESTEMDIGARIDRAVETVAALDHALDEAGADGPVGISGPTAYGPCTRCGTEMDGLALFATKSSDKAICGDCLRDDVIAKMRAEDPVLAERALSGPPSVGVCGTTFPGDPAPFPPVASRKPTPFPAHLQETGKCVACERTMDGCYFVAHDATNALCMKCYVDCIARFADKHKAPLTGLDPATQEMDYAPAMVAHDFSGGWADLM